MLIEKDHVSQSCGVRRLYRRGRIQVEDRDEGTKGSLRWRSNHGAELVRRGRKGEKVQHQTHRANKKKAEDKTTNRDKALETNSALG